MHRVTAVLRTPIFFILALLIAVTTLSPYIVMLTTSVKTPDDLFSIPAKLWPATWNWDNFAKVWDAAPIAQYLANSLIITAASTVIVLLVATPAAYYVARHAFRGRRLFLIFVLFTQMVAPTAVMIGLYREFRVLGLVDSYAALILTNSAFNIAFTVWILNGFFKSIPLELEEAARLDGCNSFMILWRIILPLAGPGLVTAAIFTFVSVWNEYVIALTLISSDDKRPLSVGITYFIGQYEVQYQYLFAACLIGILPVVIMFASIEKKLVGGLTAGALK